MRILYISSWYPFPPTNGIKIRIYHLLKALARKHRVTLLAFNRSPASEPLGAPEFCERVEVIPWVTFQPDRWRARLALFSPYPRSLADTYSPAMAQAVQRAEAQTEFDVVIACTMETARYALQSRAPTKILEEHNFNSGIMQDQYARQQTLRDKARYGLTLYKSRRFEADYYCRFDGCTVVSEQDLRGVRELVGNKLKLKVIPNCADAAYYDVDYTPEPETCVFNGSLTYFANFEAMRYFLSEIWGQIRAAAPNARLRITGDSRQVALNDLSLDNSVLLTGLVDDIRPVVGKSWAAVVPLLQGGGTRLKILEAMALGTPVISTSKGAAGLEVTPGKHLLIADTPAEFAAAVLGLFRSPAQRNELAGNARALVRERYDWARAGAEFESFVSEIADKS